MDSAPSSAGADRGGGEGCVGPASDGAFASWSTGSDAVARCGPPSVDPVVANSTANAAKQPKHVCPDCNRRYRLRSSLVCHARVHSGQRPYVCSWCGATFAYPGHLSRHRTIHEPHKYLACRVCARTFARRDTLALHILRLHPDHAPQAARAGVCGLVEGASAGGSAVRAVGTGGADAIPLVAATDPDTGGTGVCNGLPEGRCDCIPLE